MNARLRRLLVPKNALMVLNELHPGVKFSVQEQKNALHQYFCTVQVEVIYSSLCILYYHFINDIHCCLILYDVLKIYSTIIPFL